MPGDHRILRIIMIVLVMLAIVRVQEALRCWGWRGPGFAIAACNTSLQLFRLYAGLGHPDLARNFAWAHRNLGAAYSELGQLDKALAELARSIDHKPTPAAHMSRAMVHLRRHELRAAREQLREALRLDPRDEVARAELERVEAEIAAATRPPPQPDRLGRLLTNCRGGSIDRMLAACEAALVEPAIGPVQKAIALAGRGLVYSYRDRLGEAARDLAEAIRLDPAKPAYRATYGDVLRKQGQFAKAAEAYRAALALDDEFAPALAGLRALGLAPSAWHPSVIATMMT